VNERLERLLRDDDAFALPTPLERALANVELEFAEFVHLDGVVRHSERRRNNKGMKNSRSPNDSVRSAERDSPATRRFAAVGCAQCSAGSSGDATQTRFTVGTMPAA
jgi:hypothetical protein